MSALTPSPIQQFFDANGVELNGGKLFTYAGGTTTKISVFTDSTGTTAFPNPIILNSRGEPATSTGGASTGIWLVPGTAYKFVLSPATDTDPPSNPIWTVDQISTGAAAGGGNATVTDTGAVNALAVTLTPSPGSYTLGLTFNVKAANTNTGATTINVNGLGAKAITVQGNALAAGDIQSGQIYSLIYDGTQFELTSLPGPGGWVTNGNLASMAAGTVKGNNTGSPATPQDIPITSIVAGVFPGAEIMTSVPISWSGYQLEDGSAISRSGNPILFALYGTTFGAGDGSTTFNVPDMRGYFPRGANPAGVGPGPTTTSGTKLLDQIQSHNHATGISQAGATGATGAQLYGDTSNGLAGASSQTVHTDNNSVARQGYTSTGNVAAGTGTGTPSGTFGTETRPAFVAKFFYVKLG